MDARDRLRRYLEQRRELGESEFVLDGLPLEEVLKVVGAGGAASPRAKGAPPPTAVRERARETERDVAPVADVGPPAPPVRIEVPLPAARMIAPGLVPEHVVAPSVPAPRVDTPFPTWLTALDIPIGLSAGTSDLATLSPSVAQLPTLDALRDAIAVCTGCSLHATARNPVPGEGHPRAEVLCVGEAPGADEDEQGKPFVGAAGQLLTKILGAIQLTREEVFICNVLKHRPPGNRDPQPNEVAACQPFLLRQIELVQPRVILALGRFAAQTLLQTTTGIGQLRGKVHRFHAVPLVVTYHPAALLRNEAWKRPTWDDVRLARRILDASRAAAPDAGTT